MEAVGENLAFTMVTAVTDDVDFRVRKIYAQQAVDNKNS